MDQTPTIHYRATQTAVRAGQLNKNYKESFRMARQLKITIVLPFAGISGGIRVPAIYAEKLISKGHKVELLSQPHETIRMRSQIKSLVLGRGLIKQPQHGPYLDGLKNQHHVLPKAGQLRSEDVPDADIIIATFWPTAFWIYDLPPSKGKKVYFIQGHEVEPVFTGSRAVETYHMNLHKITISQHLADTLAKIYGQTNVALIKNSVDTDQFFGTERNKSSPPTIGTLFSTYPYKGTDIAFKAIEIVRRTFTDLRVISFGADKPSKRLPIPDFCEFHYRPSQSKLRSIYDRCDVWVCGSYSEGFHLPPLEAMACRCPIASTRVGGPLDTIADGVNGYLVEIGDVNGLARAISRILDKSNLEWRKMSASALETARSYTWNDAADLMEKQLFRIAESSESHRGL